MIPGIFAELERTRHVHVVEAMIDELETKIFEIDFHPGETEHSQTSGADKRNREKREAYLDTAYLRNVLISWNIQLVKMFKQAEDLETRELSEEVQPGTGVDSQNTSKFEDSNLEQELVPIHKGHTSDDTNLSKKASEHSSCTADEQGYNSERRNQMQRTSRKIKDRLQDIIEEYEGKIRDCTMRVDGMAMATQWVNQALDPDEYR